MELQIKNLLAKYWQGNTTLEEEKLVKEYFEEHSELSAEARYFEYLGKEKNKRSRRAFRHPGLRIRRTLFSSVAAAIILLFSLPFFIPDNAKQDKYAIHNPEEALEVTRAALMMVSEGLNKGKTYSNELNKFNEAKHIFKNQ